MSKGAKSTKGLIIHIEDMNDPSSVLVTFDGEPIGCIDQLRLTSTSKSVRCNIAQRVSPGMLKSVARAADKMRKRGVKAVVSVIGRDPSVDEMARRDANMH